MKNSKDYEFKSNLSDHIYGLIDMKRKLGYSYKTGMSYLRTIDRSAIKFNRELNTITTAFIQHFGEECELDSKQARYDKFRYLRDLSMFIQSMGITTIIPQLPSAHFGKSFIPHIYSEQELSNIISACDTLRAKGFAQTKSPIFSLPAFFRTLIATGLRIGECRKLKISDVDVTNNTLLVTDGKNKRQRLLPISKSLTSVLCDHLESIKLFCSKEPIYVFTTLRGKKLSISTIYPHWRLIQKKSNITFRGRNASPRIHDFRHTFAVRALEKMADSGIDPYNALPILQTYLGHMDIKSTDIYMHLTADYQAKISEKFDKRTHQLFPKLNKK